MKGGATDYDYDGGRGREGGRAGGREGERGAGTEIADPFGGGGHGAGGGGGRWTYGRRLHAPTGSCSSVR
eukprot:COSAG01_NODE_5055_length_4521_cov_1.628675_3_plen_70_part_00